MSFEEGKRTIPLCDAGSDVIKHLFQGNVPQGIWRRGKFCRMDEAGQKKLKTAFDKFGLGVWAYTLVLEVARTISDLEDQVDIPPAHISETIQYRSLGRNLIE
jgi:magnesium chelatase family protein